jgi:hypothetical protein
MANSVIELKFNDGTAMLAEIADIAPVVAGSDRQQLSGGMAEKMVASFDLVSTCIKNVASEVQAAISTVMPTSTEIEFGLKISAESGQVLALLVDGSGEASLKIKLRWEKPTAVA